MNPCHYGIDTPRRKELIASSHDVEETRQFIGADSLGYLSLEGMFAAFGRGENEACAACFSGRYPVPLTLPDPQASLFSEETAQPGTPAGEPAPALPQR
jgi:amidophosphoribosyltransferase